jgi:PBS lyase HEAT-like repeat-containing protein
MTEPRRRRQAVTAAELKAKLEADPEWRARMEAKERELRPIIERNREAAAPVIADLIAAGFYVHSIGDLYNQRLDYRRAIPILVEWLPRIDNPDVKEDIVRALSVKWTPREVAGIMIAEYRKGAPSHTPWRWAIGNALTVLATDAVFDEIVELARDRHYGRSRGPVVESLGNMKNDRAVDVLLELLDDPELSVSLPAVRALGKLGPRARRARAKLEPFAKRPEAWVRKDALKALKRIG